MLLIELRRDGLAGTRMAHAQCSTLRLRHLKIGARRRATVPKVWVSLASAYPCEDLFAKAYDGLQRAGLRQA